MLEVRLDERQIIDLSAGYLHTKIIGYADNLPIKGENIVYLKNINH